VKHKKTLAIACVLAFLAGLGSMRILTRTPAQRAGDARPGKLADLPANVRAPAANDKGGADAESASPNAASRAARGANEPDATNAREGAAAPEPPAPPDGPAKIPPALEDKGYLLAFFDLDDDGRADLLAYAPEEARVVQVLLAKDDGEFEDSPDARIPEYVAHFLSFAAEEPPAESAVLLLDER
jgi:hypothetical protein